MPFDTYFLPRRIGNLRLDTFRATFKVGRQTALGNPYWAEFNFNIKDEDEHLSIWVKHTTGSAAGNLTYDGQYKFVYDAWGRLVEVKRAYPNATSPYTLNVTSTIATLEYDGLGRRISKAVTNSADWTATYHYYYDGYRMIETHDGSADVLKQHVWGRTYVDELVQIGINDDPTPVARACVGIDGQPLPPVRADPRCEFFGGYGGYGGHARSQQRLRRRLPSAPPA